MAPEPPDSRDDARRVREAAEALRQAQQRGERPLWQRLKDATVRATVLSTVAAMDYETKTTHGAHESEEPPPAPTDLPEGALDRYLVPIRNLIEDLEHALDAATGHATAKNYALMITEEKDHEILTRWAGVRSHDVARLVPELGSPRTIERVRHRAGKRPIDGTDLPEKA